MHRAGVFLNRNWEGAKKSHLLIESFETQEFALPQTRDELIFDGLIARKTTFTHRRVDGLRHDEPRLPPLARVRRRTDSTEPVVVQLEAL